MFLVTKLVAVTQPVVLLRACLDRTSRTLTLYFEPSTDGCGSFTEYIIYGRESSVQPYVELHRHGIISDKSVSFVLPNTKKWELYITTKNACNGVDSFNSNTVLIDDTPPGLHNIDSVSVNLYTQKLYAGWSKAVESDVKGYTLFKVDPGTGTNSILRANNNQCDSFLLSTFNTSQANNLLSIAVFDSCDNEGIISNAHSPSLISHNPLAFNDLCDKKLRLDWTEYKAPGWINDRYDLFVGTDINSMSLFATLPGGTNTYDFPIPTAGLTYLFYIRAYKQASTISSSSNLISVATTSNPTGTNNRIGHVSFVSPGNTEVSMLLSPQTGIQKLNLFGREKGAPAWNKLYSNTNPQAYNSAIITGLDNTNKVYEFRSTLTNVCNDTFDSGLIHESIVLNKAAFVFTWNDYIGWSNKDAYFQRRDISNVLVSETNNNTLFQNDMDPNAWTQYQVVFYNIQGGGRIDTAKSNYTKNLVFDTTLIPNVFNPNGNLNTRFKISNPNISAGESTMRIYNRWGQKIFDGDALLGWDGKHQGKDVPHGTYIYTILVNRSDKLDQLRGTLQLLR